MTNVELLKAGRDLLLSLHKSLVDFERTKYETVHGPLTSGEFLNRLLADDDLAWLRQFSTLIVDIDEMFAQKDGYTETAVNLHIKKLREIISMGRDENFVERYEAALAQDDDSAARHAAIKALLGDD